MSDKVQTPLYVAIVEDNPVHRETYSNMILIDSDSHRVDTFADGQSFRDEIDRLDEYDCILFDIKLPDVNGIELSKEIAQIHPHLPMIFITAYSTAEEALEVLADGAEDYLPKGEYNQTLFMRSIRYAIERKRHKIESMRLYSELQQARALNAQQKEFVSMVSHEFRTPLAIIDSSAQLLRKRFQGDEYEPMRKHLGKVEHAVARLLGLMDKALCFTRLEEGKIKFCPNMIHSQEFFGDLLEEFKLIYPNNEFEVVGDELPEEFVGDSAIIEQVLSNLVSNAVKYSRSISKRITIENRLDPFRDQLRISVIDYGRGITPACIKHLGERFYRAENSIGTSGSGIGIYLCKQLLELHGGALEIESELEKGSRFTLVLPLNPEVGE